MQDKKYTKKQFDAYTKHIEKYGEADSLKFDKKFRVAYKDSKNIKEVKPDYSSAKSDSFKSAEFREDNAWINKNRPIIESLNKLYDNDYGSFKTDSSRFESLGEEYKDKKSLWEAKEGEIDWLNPNWIFNTYDKDSSLGILNSEMRDIERERQKINSKWFDSGVGADAGTPGASETGREKLSQRKNSLNKLNEELKIRGTRSPKPN